MPALCYYRLSGWVRPGIHYNVVTDFNYACWVNRHEEQKRHATWRDTVSSVTGTLWGESTHGGFPSQRASNIESVPISWCHHVTIDMMLMMQSTHDNVRTWKCFILCHFVKITIFMVLPFTQALIVSLKPVNCSYQSSVCHMNGDLVAIEGRLQAITGNQTIRTH